MVAIDKPDVRFVNQNPDLLMFALLMIRWFHQELDGTRDDVHCVALTADVPLAFPVLMIRCLPFKVSNLSF